MQEVRDIRFGSEIDLIGLHAYSDLIFCGLHPNFVQNAEKQFLITLDLKVVKSS